MKVEALARSVEDLLADLRDSCRIEAGDVIIVHSSFKSVGAVTEGLDTLLRALCEAVSPKGTLLMPAFSHPRPEGFFDTRTTPSRTGALTEALRRSPDSWRSLHPTHSVVAWGERAPELVAGHEQTSGLGLGSPLHRAVEAGAVVLMIGCPMTTCSLVHVAEAVVRPPYFGEVCYPGYDAILSGIDDQGERHVFPPHDVPTDSRGFTVVHQELERRGLLQHCRLGEAETLRFLGRDCLEVATDLLRRDPSSLLCDSAGCEVCPRAREIIADHRRREARSAVEEP